MREAIAEATLIRSLGEMVTTVLSVPAGERASWYRSMERLSRIRRSDAVYATTKLANIWLRIANACWRAYPKQDRDDLGQAEAG